MKPFRTTVVEFSECMNRICVVFYIFLLVDSFKFCEIVKVCEHDLEFVRSDFELKGIFFGIFL